MNADAAPILGQIDQSLLRRAQWRLTIHALQWSLAANIVAATLMTAALHLSFGHDDALGWFAALLGVTVIRGGLLWRYGPSAVIGRSPDVARRLLLAGLLASGFVWGFAAAFLAPDDDFAAQVLICFFAAGMTAGAAASISAARYGFEAFALPMLTLLTARLAMIGTGPALFMAAAVAAFGLIMFGVASTSRGQVENALTLWLANRRLNLDLRRAESRERRAARRAQDLDVEKNAALATAEENTMALAAVSHELRTPLNAVIGFSEMIVDEHYGSLGDERYRRYAQDIRASGTHLRALVDDLLDLSQRRAGAGGLKLQTFPVADVIGEAVAEFGVANPANAERLAVRVDPPELAIRADRRLIYQVLRNLVENALKFADPETEIRIAAARHDSESVRLRVANSGAAIPADVLDTILKPFVQGAAKAGSRPQGVGLGLALVKEFVDLHGGRIDIENVEGQSVAINIILPIDGPPPA